MGEFAKLADKIMASGQKLVTSNHLRYVISPAERDRIVAALRGADSLRALAELPPRHAVSSQKDSGNG